MKKTITLSIILLAAGLQAKGPQATPVYTSKVKIESLSELKSVTGNIKASRTARIAALESGRIDSFLVKEGQEIAVGTVIAKLDQRHIHHDLEAVAAEIEYIKSQYAKIAAELVLHKEELADLEAAKKQFKGAVSSKELRTARLQIISLESQQRVLLANEKTLFARRAKLQTSLSDTVIKAPFSGVITQRHVDKGAWVQAGGPVVTLMSTDELEAWLDIPESINATNALNKENIQILCGEQKISVRKLRLLPSVNRTSRNYTVIAELEKSSQILAGMSVKAHVASGNTKRQLTIPANAIGRNGAGYFVYAVIPGQKGMSAAAPMPIEILFRKGSQAIIRSSTLKPGMSIVTEGNERLFPMMPIKPITKTASAVTGK